MAAYKVSITVYKDPAGKTLKGPTALHFLGDICSAIGLIGILSTILCFMEDWGVPMLIGSIAAAVAGFALSVVLHKKAKRNAEEAYLRVLAQMGIQMEQEEPAEK